MAQRNITQALLVVATVVFAACGSSFEDSMFQEGDGQAVSEAGTDADALPDTSPDALPDASPEAQDDALEAEVDASCVLPPQTPGDCVVAVCDADAPILVSDPLDVPEDDDNPCTDDLCVTGGPYGLLQPGHPKKVAGSPCGEGKTCDGAGTCS